MGATRNEADDPVETAARWDAQLRLPTTTDEDRRRFAAWLDQTPVDRRAFDELQAALSVLREAASGHPELRAIRDAAREAAAPANRWRRYAAIAAVLMISIGGAASFIEREGGPRKDVSIVDRTKAGVTGAQGAGQVYETAVGERSTVTLADGSRLTLNTDSRVSVLFGPHRRDLVVLAGQALFEVAHNKGRPFIVRAGERTVTAHGTIFEVRLRSTGVEVTLIEGRVTVDRAAAGRPSAKIADLTPGQQLVSAGQDAAIHSIDVDRETSWRDGRIFFEDQPLPAAVMEMNRYSPIRIVTDPALAGLRINGMFKAGQQVNFARTLEAYLPVEVYLVNDNRIELRPRR